MTVTTDDDFGYHPGAVPVGPFAELPPLDLWRVLSTGGHPVG